MKFLVSEIFPAIGSAYGKMLHRFLYNCLKVVMIVCLVIKLNDAKAQTSGHGQVQILAPNTYSLGLYGDVPVDYSSGLPQVNVPLLKFADKDIDLDISLSYHASGIKVDQEATWVGLGWALNAGGVITREIRGLPDEYRNGSFIPRTSFPYYNGNIQQNQFTNAGTLLNLGASPNGTDNGADIFYYNFNGHAGKFFLDEAAKAIFIKYEDIQVEFLNGDYFVITDEKGIRYEFASKEYTSNLMGSTLIYISAWYLSKITSPGGGEISFDYVSGGLTNRSYQKRCYDQVYFPMRDTRAQAFPSEYYQTCIERQIEISGIVIKKITNAAGQYIEFVTSPNPRLDAETNINIGNNQLDAAVLYNAQNEVVKKFTFSYSYFQANNSHKISYAALNFLNYRLRLDSLQEVSLSGQLQSPYKFAYFGDDDPATDDPYTLPYRLSPCQDHWGYYNNSYNTMLFPANPVDKPFHKDEWNYALLGSMGYVGNPNLGFLVTGANREADEQATRAGALQKITFPTGGHSSFTFEQHEKEPNTQQPITGGLKVSRIETNDGAGHIQTKKYEYYGYSGSGCQCLLTDNPYYTWYSQKYGPDEDEYPYAQELVGLGVPAELAYQYTQIGRVDATSQLGLGINAGSPYVIVTERTPGNGYTIYNYTYAEDNDMFYDGLPVPGAYEGTYVKTINTSVYPPFTHSLNDMSSCVYPYPNFLNNDWRRGHLLSKKVYSESNQLLLEENNTYDIRALKAIQGHKIAKISEYEFFYSRYYQVGGMVKLLKQVSKQYNGDNFIETVKEFAYGSSAHKLLIESKEYRSGGDIIKTSYKYPHDFVSPTGTPNVYNEMVNRHIWSPVVEQSVTKGSTHLQSTKTNYDFWNNGWVSGATGSLIVPKTVEARQGANNYETRLRYHSYDQKADITSLSKEGDLRTSYLWGYKDQYPVAEITGVPAGMTVFYSGFEGDDLQWDAGGAGTVMQQAFTGKKAYSFGASGGTLYKSGFGAGRYILQYAYKVQPLSTVFAGNVVSEKTSPLPGGWTLYESVRDFPGSSNTVLITGLNNIIDEFRVYPLNSLMKTYAYEPLTGMTAACDANYRVTYYEYDDFGRLAFIRDGEKNILKKIIYNLDGKAASAGGETAPQWQPTGVTRCLPCSTNNNFTSTATQVQQIDRNTASATYGQLRWVDDPVAVCPFPETDWQNTAAPPVCKLINGYNTGEQLQEQINKNPCNPQYNQTRMLTSANPGLCPVPVMYRNEDMSGYFSGTNCIAPETPSSVYVSIPQGMFTASTLAAANLLAQQYGVSQANALGNCQKRTFTLELTNGSSIDFDIVIGNGATSVTYKLAKYAFQDVSMMAGSYTVTLVPHASSAADYYDYRVGCAEATSIPGTVSSTISNTLLYSNCYQIIFY